jgi:hypothetical protein
MLDQKLTAESQNLILLEALALMSLTQHQLTND